MTPHMIRTSAPRGLADSRPSRGMSEARRRHIHGPVQGLTAPRGWLRWWK